MQEKTRSIVPAMTFIVLLVCTTFAMFVVINPYEEQDSPLTDFCGGWVNVLTGTSADLMKQTLIEKAPDGTYTVEKTLPDTLTADDQLNMQSKSLFFRVYVDGVERYSYYPSVVASSGRSYGTAFHSIGLGPQDAGHSIRIVGDPVYDDNSAYLTALCIGNPDAYRHQLMGEQFIPFLFSTLILVLGFMLVIVSILIPNYVRGRSEVAYLASVAIIVGLWTMAETPVFQYALGDVMYIHSLSYLSPIIIPFPAFCFVNEAAGHPLRHGVALSACVTICVLVLCSVLNYSGIADFHSTAIVPNVVIILTLVVATVLAFSSVRNGKMGEDNIFSSRMFIGSSLIVLAFVAFDIVNYITIGKNTTDAAYFTRIGVLAGMTMLGLHYMHRLIGAMRAAAEAETYRKLAYTDALTGLGSRMAYQEADSQMSAQAKAEELGEVLCCHFDLDDLKKINDGFGHNVGDLFIVTASKAIADAFKDNGSCYRIGGDEFALFMSGETLEKRASACVEKMVKLAADYSKDANLPSPVEVSYGFALYEPDGDTTFEATEILADQRMYEMKRSK